MDSGELTKISNHSSTTQTGTNTQVDYRYQGDNPNNYVNFNGEKWRIIGVFNTDDGSGTYQWRVKLIRATGIGDLAWDSSNTNDWSTATLKTTLNGDYLSRAGSYTSIGLNETARNQIESVKWYLGAHSTNAITSETMFGYERGGTKGGGASATSWTGKVGLMYPSDYGFSNASCTSTNLYSYSSCASGSWIYKVNFNNNDTTQTSGSAVDTWTLSPKSNSADPVFYVYSNGFVDYHHANTTLAVRPVVYLSSDIGMTDGTGTINDNMNWSNNFLTSIKNHDNINL